MTLKLLVITRCSECPFFEDNPIKAIGGILTGALLADSQHGVCNILPTGEFLPPADLKIGLPPGPAREAEQPRLLQARTRRFVADKRTIPAFCPLREIEYTVTSSNGN